MHIPDNFLSTPVWATLDGVALPAIAYVSRKAQQFTDTRRLPLLGIMGAFIFAAQMINFPVGIGTSGHLLGGTLLACVLGPWAAALVLTAILVIQALVFQDGGVLALGANVVNMALLGVFAGYLPVIVFSRSRYRNLVVFIGAALSVMVSGVCALSELLISGIRMPALLVGISLGFFLVNALIEGGITVSVMRAIERLNHERAEPGYSRTVRESRGVLISSIAAFSIAFAALGILLTSTLPDGLEHLARTLGIPFGINPVYHSPLGDYRIHALGTTWFSRAAAGMLGLLCVYLICAFASHLLSRGRRSFS